MAIRFHCRRCRQLLAIATRKAGTEIRCPKCGEPQLVPAPEACNGGSPAASGAPDVSSAPAPAVAASAFESMDVSKWLQEGDEGSAPPAPPVVASPVRPPEPAEEPSQVVALPPPVVLEPVEPPEPAQPIGAVPPGMVLLRRRTMHLQSLFFLLLAAGTFASGYYLGRQSPSRQLAFGPTLANAALAPTMVEGQVIFESREARLLGDAGATVIALPEGKLPKTPLALSTEQPNAPQLRELGGAQARAGAKGQFALLLRPGNYRILFISAHAQRAADRDIDEADLGEIRRYIAAPDKLIGPFKYAWGTHPLGPGLPPPNHDFGRSEAK